MCVYMSGIIDGTKACCDEAFNNKFWPLQFRPDLTSWLATEDEILGLGDTYTPAPSCVWYCAHQDGTGSCTQGMTLALRQLAAGPWRMRFNGPGGLYEADFDELPHCHELAAVPLALLEAAADFCSSDGSPVLVTSGSVPAPPGQCCYLANCNFHQTPAELEVTLAGIGPPCTGGCNECTTLNGTYRLVWEAPADLHGCCWSLVLDPPVCGFVKVEVCDDCFVAFRLDATASQVGDLVMGFRTVPYVPVSNCLTWNFTKYFVGVFGTATECVLYSFNATNSCVSQLDPSSPGLCTADGSIIAPPPLGKRAARLTVRAVGTLVRGCE